MEVKSTRREWAGDWSDCFYRDDDYEQYDNVQMFANIADHLYDLCGGETPLYWPNYEKAPWHLQCAITVNGRPTEMNFWPHKAKAQISYQKVTEGWMEIHMLINSVFFTNDDQDEDDFDVIE